MCQHKDPNFKDPSFTWVHLTHQLWSIPQAVYLKSIKYFIQHYNVFWREQLLGYVGCHIAREVYLPLHGPFQLAVRSSVYETLFCANPVYWSTTKGKISWGKNWPLRTVCHRPAVTKCNPHLTLWRRCFHPQRLSLW